MKKCKQQDYDIIIVGAGPAGATLARLLPKQYRVLIIDKKPIEQGIDHRKMKCCGGLLSEAAQKVMAEMDLNLPADVLVEGQPFRLRVMDLNYKISRDYQKHYYNMDRAKFEMWLISLIPEEVTVRGDMVVRDFHRCQCGVELTVHCRKENITKVITARTVVAADGASSIFRHRLYPEMGWKKYVALQEWYKNSGEIDYYAAIVDEEITDFYSWLIPKGDSILLGAAFDMEHAGGSPNDRFQLLKSKLEAKGFQFGERVLREGCEIIRPINSRLVTGNHRIAFIGEAGGMISPSSSEGFSYAFRSAKMLSEAIRRKGLRHFAGCYAKRVQRLKRNIRLRNIKAWGMYHKIPRRLALKTGIGAI